MVPHSEFVDMHTADMAVDVDMVEKVDVDGDVDDWLTVECVDSDGGDGVDERRRTTYCGEMNGRDLMIEVEWWMLVLAVTVDQTEWMLEL